MGQGQKQRSGSPARMPDGKCSTSSHTSKSTRFISSNLDGQASGSQGQSETPWDGMKQHGTDTDIMRLGETAWDKRRQIGPKAGQLDNTGHHGTWGDAMRRHGLRETWESLRVLPTSAVHRGARGALRLGVFKNFFQMG